MQIIPIGLVHIDSSLKIGLDFLIMGKSIVYHLGVLAILLGETGIGETGSRQNRNWAKQEKGESGNRRNRNRQKKK
jgi:hypothetical protein